jgi:hypothetical protein
MSHYFVRLVVTTGSKIYYYRIGRHLDACPGTVVYWLAIVLQLFTHNRVALWWRTFERVRISVDLLDSTPTIGSKSAW